MIKILLLAVVPFMTQHRNVVPKTEVSTNFYGSVTGIVNSAYVKSHAGGVDTNAVIDIANATIETNDTVKALASSVSGLQSSKADKTTPYYAGNLASLTADGNLADSGIAKDSVVTRDESGRVNADAFRSSAVLTDYIYNQGAGAPWIDVKNGALSPDAPSAKWYYLGTTDDREIAVKGDISAENSAFSNAVLAVGLNIDTNSVAVLNEIAATFGGFPIKGTATTVGGLLAALAAAAAWLKKNKLDKTAVVAPSVSATAGQAADAKAVNDALAGKVDNIDGIIKNQLLVGDGNDRTHIAGGEVNHSYYDGVGVAFEIIKLPKKSGTFALTSDIDARLPYPLYAVPSTGLLKDRALNTTSLASVTVPDNFTDLLVRASVASSLSVTMSEATTKYGDTFPGEAGEYLITITKTGAAEAYVRTIKLEEVA